MAVGMLSPVVQVLEQYANVQHRDQLRCNAAFFMGLLRQVANGRQARAPSLAKKNSVLIVPKPLVADPSTVSPEAKAKLAELHSQGTLESALMDQHCLGLLAAIPASLQVSALISIAGSISAADNKRACITQLLKSIQASATSTAAAAPKSGVAQLAKSGNAAASPKLVSNTGRIINPNDISIRLNPSSVFYDPDLAMSWRVLTRQDKADWQTKATAGKHPKLADLSKPRQKLARQLHVGHAQYHAATAAAWKHTDSAIKESLLLNADNTGQPISLLQCQQRPNPDPDFHDMDFPLLQGMQASKPNQATGSEVDPATAAPPAATSGSSQQTNNGTSSSIPVSQEGRAQDIHGNSVGGLDCSSPSALPMYNMGMAFQQSLSLQDISQADPITAKPKSLTDDVSQV